AERIEQYIYKYREKILPARRHPYLLVTHWRGPSYGQPLSKSSLGSQTMAKIRSVDPSLAGISPHSLRHHFNYELSIAFDAQNEGKGAAAVNQTREQDIRAFLNGHRSTKSAE